MILSEEKRKEFDEIARPLIKWLNDNCHPHCSAVVDSMTAELYEGVHVHHTEDFLID